ncbi:MAG: lysophospholipase [Defluviitaleaceae bacterium]|nr:lysophospholipase [Defluviitaleaceae bacterium]
MPKLKHLITGIFSWGLKLAILLMILTIALYNVSFGRRVEPYRGFLEYEHRLTGFYSGQNRLTGYIFGEDNDRGLIVISHGLGGGGLSYLREIMFFVDNGWRVFTFDKTGSHNSEGSGTRGLPQSAIDLNAALNYIASQNRELPIMLYGHSWGGFAVTAVLNFDHDINAVVSLAGYAEPLMMLQEGAGLMIGPFAVLVTPYLWAYQRILFGDYAGLCAIEGINSADIPVKIIHGRDDNVVSYNGAGIIAHRERISNPNAVFVSRYYPNRSDHVYLTLDPLLMLEINEFFTRYLP